MKVNDPNLSSLASTGAAVLDGPTRTSSSFGAGVSDAATSDGVHLSELVRTLRSLAADSPELQARLENIARSVGGGAYRVDAPGTASKIVDDAIQRP